MCTVVTIFRLIIASRKFPQSLFALRYPQCSCVYVLPRHNVTHMAVALVAHSPQNFASSSLSFQTQALKRQFGVVLNGATNSLNHLAIKIHGKTDECL